MTVQSHNYSTTPFGAHDEADRLADEAAQIERQEQEMKKAFANGVLRLMRPEIGATADEAEQMVDDIGAADVNAWDDATLKAKVEELRGDDEAPAFDIGGTIDSLLEYVDGDPVKAAAVAEAERGEEKPRKRLLKQLDELSAPAEDGLGNSTDAGAEDTDGQADTH